MAYATDELLRAIVKLENRAAVLVERLQVITESRPENPEPSLGRAERSVFSPLGQGLMEAVHRLNQIDSQLLRLAGNLAV